MEQVELTQMTALASALAIGLLIGVERGWKAREAREGERVAGLRTYGLIGLLGGIAGLLSSTLGALALLSIFLGFTLAATVAYAIQRQTTTDVSMTGLVAMLLTFLLGALATLGHITLAATLVVVTTMLLGMKSTLHGWLRKLEKKELSAAMQLLLISIVLLPVLPNRGYGPWESLNPYEIWWMVVFIASISFVGYFSIKIAGAKKGVLLTAIAGGLASSTALTLEYARLARKKTGLKNLLVAGILIANGIMFLRILLIASLIHPALCWPLLAPMASMMLVSVLFVFLFMRKKIHYSAESHSEFTNPLDIKQALIFGLILAAVILMSQAAMYFFGTSGLYVLAAISGIADVDAINLSLAKMSLKNISVEVAMIGIIMASAANTLSKLALAIIVGGIDLGIKMSFPLVSIAIIGIVVAFIAPF